MACSQGPAGDGYCPSVRIRVIRDGKPKSIHLQALQQDYAARIGHFVELRIEDGPGIRPSSRGRRTAPAVARRRLLEALRESYKVVLDPRGREWTSEECAEWLGERAMRGTRELAFLVGGEEGFAAGVRDQADLLLGLSRMTLTHDWACTLLLEQIYRGFTILRGYPYPR
jgi:23S rRNA (pseudouridine1915-N3)-methyltransferase